MTDFAIARIRAIDYDARRDPATPLFCIHCQKDLKDGKSVRYGRILMIDGGALFTLHPDDVHAWLSGRSRVVLSSGLSPSRVDDLGWRAFGTSCARRHGLEWTTERMPEVDAPGR